MAPHVFAIGITFDNLVESA